MRYFLTFTSLLLVVVLACSFMPSPKEEEIYSRVVRFHIIANSDSEADQADKINVRNAVEGMVSDIVSQAQSAAESEALLREALPVIRDCAEACLREMGNGDTVSVVLGEAYYPTKSYGEITLPAGTYPSLQIRIGEAAGHNWWCVLFPQIGTSLSGVRGNLEKTGFTPDQIRILTDGESPRYKIKFKILELFSEGASQ